MGGEDISEREKKANKVDHSRDDAERRKSLL
jgi:hypothetical protein